MLLTTTDPELLGDLLRAAVGLIATLRIAGDEESLNVYVHDVTVGEGREPPHLDYRHLGEHLQPTGRFESVEVTAITHLHLW